MRHVFSRLRSRRVHLTAIIAVMLMAMGGMLAVPAAQAAVRPAAQPSWCGWHPANDSHDPGWVTYSYVNIRTGQGTQCNVIGGGSNGDYVVVHCYAYNAAGQEWYYSWDSANGVTGWVIADSVLATWDPVAC